MFDVSCVCVCVYVHVDVVVKYEHVTPQPVLR